MGDMVLTNRYVLFKDGRAPLNIESLSTEFKERVKDAFHDPDPMVGQLMLEAIVEALKNND